MKRRDFMIALGGAAVPLAVRAQQASPVIGVLSVSSQEAPAQVPH